MCRTELTQCLAHMAVDQVCKGVIDSLKNDSVEYKIIIFNRAILLNILCISFRLFIIAEEGKKMIARCNTYRSSYFNKNKPLNIF